MSRVLLYIPSVDLVEAEAWQAVRQWVKTAGVPWDKVRCTPAPFGRSKQVDQDELKSALQLIRQGQFDRVVFAKLPEGYETNLDWLMFAISCQTQSIRLETLEGELELPRSAQQLAQHYSSLSTTGTAKQSRSL